MNIYITSINKGDGKTLIASGIAAVMQSLGYNSGFYKPIQTNAIDKGKYLVSPDLTFAKSLDPHITTHSTYMTVKNNLPDNNTLKIDMQEIQRDYSIMAKKSETVIVEAPSSLMTPINNEIYAYKIPQELNLPVVLIVCPQTDSLGHCLSEIQAAKSTGIDIKGIIINKYSFFSDSEDVKEFPSLIEKYCDVKILGKILHFNGKIVQVNVLFTEILNGINLEELFDMKIPKLNNY